MIRYLSYQAMRCDHSRMELFLRGECDSQEIQIIGDHLQHCVSCRQHIEIQAAEPCLWQEAEAIFRSNDLQPEILESQKRDTAPAMVQAVLDSLPASEFPERMGRLGNYEITGVIGSGGMGVVLKALDTTLDRTVAIKVLAPHLANNAIARKRFAREAKAAAAVIHPNVIPIHSVTADASLPYLAMAFVKGGSLQTRLEKDGFLPAQEILRIGSQIAAGLAAAHGQGLVHRDIKPANILLGDGIERVTITDFGLARAVDDASVTKHQMIAGTPQFMSPEQAKGESVDQRSDMFSLGSLLYSLATGRPPFRADSSYAVMRKICDENPTPIRELNPEIPEWLSGFVGKMMAKSPSDRFESTHQVAQLLESSLAHFQRPTAIALPREVALLGKKRNHKNLFMRGVLLMILFISMVAAFVMYFPGQQDYVQRDAESKKIAALVANWKEHDVDSQTAKEKRNEILELHTAHAGKPGTEKFLNAKRKWANELLPILLAGVETEKAEFLVRFTEPFEQIRDADQAATEGRSTKPIGWEWQAIHMLALGRQGLLADSYYENDMLIKKIEVNIKNGASPESTTSFFGQQRSLREVVRECKLHRAMIVAINGPPSKGPADRVPSDNERSKSTESNRIIPKNSDSDETDYRRLKFSPDVEKSLAAIPDRLSLLQADDKYLAIFELMGDDMIAKALRNVVETDQPDQVAGQLGIVCWQRLTTLFPTEYRKGLVQFNIQGGHRWAGFFMGSGKNDVGRKGYSLSIAKYTAAKIPDLKTPAYHVTARRGTLDWTIVHEMGHYICLKMIDPDLDNNAIELFSQAFDGDGFPQPNRRKKPADYPEDGSPVLDGNFVTSYAERTPGDEEVCETFTTFLLVDELPDNDSLVAKKIRFFNKLKGFPELRAHIQQFKGKQKKGEIAK